MLKETILFIGGGNMAEGIIRGIINTQTMQPNQIMVSELLPERKVYLRETYQIEIVEDLMEAVAKADVIFIAVRPQDAKESVVAVAGAMNPEQIIISICAGIDLDRLNEWTGNDKKMVRVMPNVLIEARNGYSGVCVSEKITGEDKSIISALMDTIGKTMFIPEQQFNEFTAFSCAGPAYVMYYLAALIDAGVESGFSRADATLMAVENMIGCGKMIAMTGKNPYQITDNMTSPAGVTIEGCHVLSKSGMHGIVMDAVRAAVKRANEF